MRYPRLAALRAQRKRQEDEIAQPYVGAMLRAQGDAASERKARQSLERLMASKVAPHIFGHVSRTLAEGVKHHILDVVRKVYPTGGVVQLEFLADQLCWGDPTTIARRVLDEYKHTCGPNIRVRVMDRIEDMQCTTIQLSIPELHYRHAMTDREIW